MGCRVCRARYVYLWLRVVEATSVPLAVLLLLYVVSGYGMIYPGVLGLTYRTSSYLHTHPLLRYLTSILVALHGYGGSVLLSSRYLGRYRAARAVAELLGLVFAVTIVATSTAVELALLLR
ncbi:MAG: hypothetical protein LM564_06140 [Desulfurococcaceae archaeon]|nr:hypothetical protein [Desulfurococcaceae archaeon]